MISLPGVIENHILKWKIIVLFMLHITTCTWYNTVRSMFCACAYISFIHCYVLAWDSLGILAPNWHTQFTQLVYDDISQIIKLLNTHFSLKNHYRAMTTKLQLTIQPAHSHTYMHTCGIISAKLSWIIYIYVVVIIPM